MRTTIRLTDTLLRQAKAQAAAAGRSLNDFIADAVRAAVVPRTAVRHPVSLPTFKGRGLQPGIDLDDSSALLDALDNTRYVHGVAPDPPRRVAERPRKR